MSDINITNSELNFQGDMVGGDKIVNVLPPTPPREFGDVVGISSTAWNLGLVLKQQGKLALEIIGKQLNQNTQRMNHALYFIFSIVFLATIVTPHRAHASDPRCANTSED